MISFFRKIRQKLLRQNRVTRYLVYALGEIALVMVGILLALQVNNWNEGRKAASAEKQLLSNLRGEFNDNLDDLDSIAQKVDEVIFSLEKVFDLFSNTQKTQNQDSLNIWLSKALSSPNWKPSEYLLNNLSNSGSIADLKNENLKLLLYKWSRQRNEMREVQDRTEKTGEEIIAFLKEFGSLRNVDVENSNFKYRPSTLVLSNQSLIADARFENQIDDKLYMYTLNRRWLKTARETLVQLIEETEQ